MEISSISSLNTQSLTALLGDWDGSSHCYLLIDNSAFDGVWLNQKALNSLTYAPPLIAWLKAQAYPWLTIIGDAALPKEAACVPLLVQFTSPYKLELLIRELGKTPDARSGVLCLKSQNNLPELQQRLKQRCHITIGQDRCVLAYFDANLWEECVNVFNEQQRREFLSAASRWIWFDRDHEPCHWEAESRLHDPIDYSLAFSPEQQDKILRVGEADRVDRYLTQYYETQAWRQNHSPQQRYEWLKQRLAQAQTFSLSGIPDLAAFCGLCLEHGDTFPDTQAGQNLLTRIKSQSNSLAQVLESSL